MESLLANKETLDTSMSKVSVKKEAKLSLPKREDLKLKIEGQQITRITQITSKAMAIEEMEEQQLKGNCPK